MYTGAVQKVKVVSYVLARKSKQQILVSRMNIQNCPSFIMKCFELEPIDPECGGINQLFSLLIAELNGCGAVALGAARCRILENQNCEGSARCGSGLSAEGSDERKKQCEANATTLLGANLHGVAFQIERARNRRDWETDRTYMSAPFRAMLAGPG